MLHSTQLLVINFRAPSHAQSEPSLPTLGKSQTSDKSALSESGS